MSFADKLILWLHIAAAIFTIGPVTIAISSTPRYIRRRDLPILRYLSRITLIFAAAALLVLVFGIVAADQENDFSRPWVTIAMTLFVVAFVLLVLIMRDQRRAVRALTPAGTVPASDEVRDDTAVPAAAGAAPGPAPARAAAGPADAGAADTGAASAGPGGSGEPGAADQAGSLAGSLAEHVASVERGRIAAMGGVVNLIWLVILVLMVWRP